MRVAAAMESFMVDTVFEGAMSGGVVTTKLWKMKVVEERVVEEWEE